MATKIISGWHKSLNKVFRGSERWWQSMIIERDTLAEERKRLDADLSKEGLFLTDPSTLGLIGLSYENQASILSAQGQWEELAQPLQWAVAWRALDFRSLAGRSLPAPKQPVPPLHASMEAVGPTMLSQWELGKVCAEQLILVAHKDQDINGPVHRKQYWGKGTNDAFLIFLLSQAYDIPTHYEPANPMVPAYKDLLQVWQTKDQPAFQKAMSSASEFHIAHSYYGGAGMKDFEFEDPLDIIYPGELLAVQALRRRNGLPEFETGHELIDMPWSILRNMKPCAPDPMIKVVEDRLKDGFPAFS